LFNHWATEIWKSVEALTVDGDELAWKLLKVEKKISIKNFWNQLESIWNLKIEDKNAKTPEQRKSKTIAKDVNKGTQNSQTPTKDLTEDPMKDRTQKREKDPTKDPAKERRKKGRQNLGSPLLAMK
jgi:hypothetical protein